MICNNKSKNQLNETADFDQRNLYYFFSKPTFLTASAQLHLEMMTMSLGQVYTLSPAFRAEKSLTRHHLAEFYMLEAELIDMTTLDQLLDLAEDFLKRVSLKTLKKALESDISENFPKAHIEFLINLFDSKKFVRISYVDALKILNSLMAKKKNVQLIEFGQDLNKEQEKLLVQHFDHTPVFICKYPREIKPFYMRRSNDDDRLVDNFDLLVPNVGEIIGGSLREYRLNFLTDRMQEKGLNTKDFELYLETKRYGAMKLGGFGLGLERFIQFLFNIENIKDTCAFPRSLYNCKM